MPFTKGELIHHSFRNLSSLTSSDEETLTQVREVREIRDEIKDWVRDYFKPTSSRSPSR